MIIIEDLNRTSYLAEYKNYFARIDLSFFLRSEEISIL